jgi:hypothetical protein
MFLRNVGELPNRTVSRPTRQCFQYSEHPGFFTARNFVTSPVTANFSRILLYHGKWRFCFRRHFNARLLATGEAQPLRWMENMDTPIRQRLPSCNIANSVNVIVWEVFGDDKAGAMPATQRKPPAIQTSRFFRAPAGWPALSGRQGEAINNNSFSTRFVSHWNSLTLNARLDRLLLPLYRIIVEGIWKIAVTRNVIYVV